MGSLSQLVGCWLLSHESMGWTTSTARKERIRHDLWRQKIMKVRNDGSQKQTGSNSSNGFIIKWQSVDMDGLQTDQLLNRNWNSSTSFIIFQFTGYSDFHQLKIIHIHYPTILCQESDHRWPRSSHLGFLQTQDVSQRSRLMWIFDWEEAWFGYM